jgi:hypothetical protein
MLWEVVTDSGMFLGHVTAFSRSDAFIIGQKKFPKYYGELHVRYSSHNPVCPDYSDSIWL